MLLAGSDRSKRGGLRIAIAKQFAAHGVAALVYDSPGTGSSGGNALLESGRYSRDWDRSLCFSAADIRCPVLAIWGQEDSFLPPNQSAARLKKYLTDSHHPDYEVIVFQNASHFLTLPGSRADFVPGYLDTMVNWLGRHFGSDVSAGPQSTSERAR